MVVWMLVHKFFQLRFLVGNFKKKKQNLWNLENQNHLNERISSGSHPTVECMKSTQTVSSGVGVGWQGCRWEGLDGRVTWIHTQTFGPCGPEVSRKRIHTCEVTVGILWPLSDIHEFKGSFHPYYKAPCDFFFAEIMSLFCWIICITSCQLLL